MWSKNCNHYVKRKTTCEDQKAKVFMVVLGRCDKMTTNHLESSEELKEMEINSDMETLLETIKILACNANELKHGPMQAAKACKMLVMMFHHDDEELPDYCKKFTGLAEVLERLHGETAPMELAKKSMGCAKLNHKMKVKQEQDRMLAALSMEGANKEKFSAMPNRLQQDHALGKGDGNLKHLENAEDVL